MAEVRWRRKALDDLNRLDQWRESDLGLPPISPAIVVLIEDYFARVDFSQMRPGSPVVVAGEPLDLLLLFIQVKRSEPYKVFFRGLETESVAEIRHVRHPRQRPIERRR
jgi:hypothetical protein